VRFLCSYWLFRGETLDAPGADVLIDSGGFSAMNSNAKVTVGEYAAWLRRNGQGREYACLDVVGNPLATERNQALLERQGLTPFPVFHALQPLDHLRRMVSRYDRLAFGGMVPHLGRGTLGRAFGEWLERAWRVVLDEQERSGREKRVHGFGCTRIDVVQGWPWWSVDSSSWMYGVRFADLQLFLPDRGRFVLVNLFRPETIYPHRRLLLEQYGIQPAVLAVKTRYAEQRDAFMVASAKAYRMMEQWVADYGRAVRVYLACSPSQIRCLMEDRR
jgi:hypothetical protein